MGAKEKKSFGQQKKQNFNSGLGKAIIRKRFQGARPQDGDTRLHTTDVDDGASWARMQSVTQEGNLDEFLNTAQLAGTEFTAERLNIQVITTQHSSTANPYLLTPEQEAKALQQHAELQNQLTVPRRPHWDETTTAEELQQRERESFLEWRRSLAVITDERGLLLTPFERNIEVWRQLWRVLERSDLVVQIVDARNPLFFRNEDLERYVRDVDPRKRNLLLVNKADMLTRDQRAAWARYFRSHQIRFSFFSAALAKRANDEEQLQALADEAKALELRAKLATLDDSENLLLDSDNVKADADLASAPAEDEDLRILTTSDLLDLFTSECPEPIRPHPDHPNRITVGLVGYPNVGKSSTINALCGSKRVSVSATPGKTKHFQTLHLTDNLVLCDCPGLVFPSFATTKADMVCSGVLPIDQLREHSAPATLVAQRIPKPLLESIYGIRIRIYDETETGRQVPTGSELCRAYALARGYMTQGQGNPDEPRAVRYLLKDYVRGKLVFVHPPPDYPGTPEEFNAALHAKVQTLATKRPPPALPAAKKKVDHASRSQALDQAFFTTDGTVRVGTKGKFATSDFARSSLGRGVTQGNGTAEPTPNNKKHHKKGKKNHKVRIPVRDE